MVALGSRAGAGPEFLSNLLPPESHLLSQCVSMAGLPGQATPLGIWSLGDPKERRGNTMSQVHISTVTATEALGLPKCLALYSLQHLTRCLAQALLIS